METLCNTRETAHITTTNIKNVQITTSYENVTTATKTQPSPTAHNTTASSTRRDNSTTTVTGKRITAKCRRSEKRAQRVVLGDRLCEAALVEHRKDGGTIT